MVIRIYVQLFLFCLVKSKPTESDNEKLEEKIGALPLSPLKDSFVLDQTGQVSADIQELVSNANLDSFKNNIVLNQMLSAALASNLQLRAALTALTEQHHKFKSDLKSDSFPPAAIASLLTEDIPNFGLPPTAGFNGGHSVTSFVSGGQLSPYLLPAGLDDQFSLMNGVHEIGACKAAFSVKKVHLSKMKVEEALYFKDLMTNVGNVWHDGSFVAPCEGIYFFSFHAISPENQDFTLALMKNGVQQVTAHGLRSGFQQGSNTVLLHLKEKDIVQLRLMAGALYEHPFEEAYTTFTGFLLGRV